jgi:hypothetical protein
VPVAFGASVDGVRALLPHRRIDETSKPTEEQVERFLASGSGWVSVRLGYPTSFAALDAEATTTFEELAAGLVELYAGAFAEDAAHPEQAGPGESSYGSILWERFLKGVDELLEALGKATDGGAGDGELPVGQAPGSIAYSFPPPTFRTIPTPPFTAPNIGAPARGN